MASKHRWISHTTGGRYAAGTLSHPMTLVLGRKPTSSESMSGIFSPP